MSWVLCHPQDGYPHLSLCRNVEPRLLLSGDGRHWA
ncbi:MAG: hypothetical protein DCF32_21020 [Leptolyngbya sp.]|nr:MAG: hypothetical protein DCF32_21020 [Leptolyngbya sp.]